RAKKHQIVRFWTFSILSLKTAALRASSKCLQQMRGILRGPSAEKPDHRYRRLLRARRKRPRRRAAEKRDERAPPHSITSSARAIALLDGVAASRVAAMTATLLPTGSTRCRWAGRDGDAEHLGDGGVVEAVLHLGDGPHHAMLGGSRVGGRLQRCLVSALA